MSDAVEPDPSGEPGQSGAPDADAWATACEEDLAAEKARRRAEHGPQYGTPAEELRRLADAVSEKVTELGRPFAGTVASAAAQGVAQQLIAQARAAIEPVVERNPQVFDHIAAAGGELLAAYRAAVTEAEGRWTATAPGTTARTGDTTASDAPAGPERIDLDKQPGGPEKPEEPAGPEDSAGREDSAGQDSAKPEGPRGPHEE